MIGKLCKRGPLLAALFLASCNSDETEGLARVARLSAAKLEEMTGGAPNKVAASFESMRANWNELALDARVSLRLRWEKDLQKAAIQVQAGDGVVELKGKVADIVQRQRAVQVAQSTVGVVEVIDSLELEERR
jgi:osmotically-inducible protein OsmY